MASDVKISFLSKEIYKCPVCNAEFRREELLSGSGRLIAGDLTDELHRLYEPSSKYGIIYPLAYQATVCPECWFASMDDDFAAFPPKDRGKAHEDRAGRKEDVLKIFPQADFNKPRDLINGAASLYLTARCYEYYPGEFSPTLKQGIAILRSAWLLDAMNKKYPGRHFDWLAALFKKKAQFFYSEALRKEQDGTEPVSAIKFFGPDTDKNYAYEGVLYLAGLLKLRYGPRNDTGARREALEDVKRTVAKMFGLGKTSKSKPGPLLEYARSLYNSINKELNVSADAP
jgi:uncharacterized protein (DUF2225 family)